MATDQQDSIKIGIVSISDRASTGVYEDKGLPALQEWLTRALKNSITFEPRLIPDEQGTISATLSWLRSASRLSSGLASVTRTASRSNFLASCKQAGPGR